MIYQSCDPYVSTWHSDLLKSFALMPWRITYYYKNLFIWLKLWVRIIRGTQINTYDWSYVEGLVVVYILYIAKKLNEKGVHMERKLIIKCFNAIVCGRNHMHCFSHIDSVTANEHLACCAKNKLFWHDLYFLILCIHNNNPRRQNL